MLIEYLGSFFSPYWGWDVPWEALIKVTETRTLWKHSLFIVAISFCSNTLTHYRAFLDRTIDPFLVSHYRTREINSLKFNTFPPHKCGSRKERAWFAFSPAMKTRQIWVGSWWRKTLLLKQCAGHFACLLFGESVVFVHSLWYFHSPTISFKSPFMSHS